MLYYVLIGNMGWFWGIVEGLAYYPSLAEAWARLC